MRPPLARALSAAFCSRVVRVAVVRGVSAATHSQGSLPSMLVARGSAPVNGFVMVGRFLVGESVGSVGVGWFGWFGWCHRTKPMHHQTVCHAPTIRGAISKAHATRRTPPQPHPCSAAPRHIPPTPPSRPRAAGWRRRRCCRCCRSATAPN